VDESVQDYANSPAMRLVCFRKSEQYFWRAIVQVLILVFLGSFANFYGKVGVLGCKFNSEAGRVESRQFLFVLEGQGEVDELKANL
jgi:hypothetical protein